MQRIPSSRAVPYRTVPYPCRVRLNDNRPVRVGGESLGAQPGPQAPTPPRQGSADAPLEGRGKVAASPASWAVDPQQLTPLPLWPPLPSTRLTSSPPRPLLCLTPHPYPTTSTSTRSSTPRPLTLLSYSSFASPSLSSSFTPSPRSLRCSIRLCS